MRKAPAWVAGLILIVLSATAAPAVAELIADDWNPADDVAPLEPVPHRPIYVMPLSYNASQREAAPLPAGGRAQLERWEVVYQFSAKTVLVPELLTDRGDLWLGYTQKGWWQGYNRHESHPFRETNYEPELIYAYRPTAEIFGVAPKLLTVRLNHLSDGRGRFRSRSFNRVGAGLLFDDGEQAVEYRAWYALPAGGGVEPDELADYFGRVQFDWYRAVGPATLHLSLRNNLLPSENRSSLAVSYSFPTASPHLHGFVEYRHGYNDGLVDYDHATNRISLGAKLASWR